MFSIFNSIKKIVYKDIVVPSQRFQNLRLLNQFSRNFNKKVENDFSKLDNINNSNSDSDLNKFIDSINNREFLAESFPVFSPNLGTDVYAAFYGIELEYADETSYAIHAEEVAMLKQISKCIK